MQEIDDCKVLLEEMKHHLSYDPETGDFIWIKKGLKKASNKNAHGYIRINFKCKSYTGHRLAWLFTYGKWSEKFITHIDGDRSNNKINNLLEIAPQEISFNAKRILPESGYVGVKSINGKWRSKIIVNNKHIFLGTYDTPELANEAYQAAKLKYHIIGDTPANRENMVNQHNLIKKEKSKEKLENLLNEQIKKYKAKSGYKGVCKSGNKWVSQIYINGKIIYLGRFETPELANETYQTAKLKYHVIGNANES